MLTLRPSTIRPPCSPHAPRHIAGCYLTYSRPCHPALYPPTAACQSISITAGPAVEPSRRGLSLCLWRKEPSCERPFVSFQNYLWVFKADQPCCLPPFIYQSWVVVLGNATGLRPASRRYVLTQRVSLMPHCNLTSLIKTYRGYMPFSGRSDRKFNWNVHFMETFISPAVTKVYDLQVSVLLMRRKGSKVVSKSQISLCNHMKTRLSHCFVVGASFSVVRSLGNDPANSHLAARLSCCR